MNTNTENREKQFGVLGLRDISIEEIKTDYYQRAISRFHIKNIVDNFDERLFDPLRVCWRDGAWYCYDGQHRVAAARTIGYDKVPCIVTEPVSIEEEAMLFVKANTVASSRPLTPYAEVWAGIIGKDERSLELDAVVKEAGFVLGGDKKSKNTICCIRRLQLCLDLYGREALLFALKLIKEVYPDDKEAKKATFVEGLTRFIKMGGDHVNIKKFAGILRRRPAKEINETAATVMIFKGVNRWVYIFQQIYGDSRIVIAA